MADFSWIFETSTFFLIIIGFFVGIMSVTIGGGMFFSAPFIQWLFPGVTFGAVVGNIKCGSFFRSMASTISTHQHIQYKENFKIAAVALCGTLIGVTLIYDLDQKWLFPAIIVAVILAFTAPKIASRVNKKSFHIATFLTGIYSGFIGAGTGIVMIAILRLRYPDDTDIAFVKMQARFIEWFIATTAVVAHFYHGNLVASIALPWATGSVLGGFAGGAILKRLGSLPGYIQKYVLYTAFIFALLVAGYKFFTS